MSGIFLVIACLSGAAAFACLCAAYSPLMNKNRFKSIADESASPVQVRKARIALLAFAVFAAIAVFSMGGFFKHI